MYGFPRLVIPSKVVLPPVEYCRGTRPSQAARSRAFRNWRSSPTAVISAVAPIGPMPGIVMSRRAVSCFAANTSICQETAASLISTIFSSSQKLFEPSPYRGLQIVGLIRDDARDVELEKIGHGCPFIAEPAPLVGEIAQTNAQLDIGWPCRGQAQRPLVTPRAAN